MTKQSRQDCGGMRDGRSEIACVKMGAGRFSTRALLWFIGSYPSVIPALVTVRADSTAAEPLPWWRAKLEKGRFGRRTVSGGNREACEPIGPTGSANFRPPPL